MAEPERTPTHGGYARLVRGLGIGEAFVCVTVAGVLGWLGFVDLRVLFVALALRIAAWVFHLREMWGPVAIGLDIESTDEIPTNSRIGSRSEFEASQRREGSQGDDSKSGALPEESEERQLQLAAAELALRRLPTHFGWGYGLGWFASLTLAGVVGLLGGPAPAPVGAAEMLALTCASLSLAMIAVVLVSTLVYQILFNERVRLTSALVRRRLEPRRARTSLARTAAGVAAVTVMAGWLNAAACGGYLRVEAVRVAAVTEQLRLAQVGAMSHDSGAGPIAEELVLLSFEELPRSLTEIIEVSATVEAVAVHEVRLNRALAAAPVRDGRWVVATKTIDEKLGTWLMIVLVSLLLVTPALALLFFKITRAIWTPVERVGELARRLVEEGDLTSLERLPPLADDEFGRLARYFSSLLDMLYGLVRSASKVADGDLRVELDHPGELHDAFRAMIEHLTEMVTRIRQTSIELASAAARIQRITQRQVEAAEQQSTSVVEVRQTVQSLATSAEEIATTATAVLDDAEQTVLTTAAMVGRINALSDQAESIGELLDLIREIAKRSDLLALNGALESTRAGEAGRGFALVATEMRRLAERVTGTVVDVGVRVSQIQSASEATVRATEDSRKLAERTAEAARAISQVTKKQGVDTEQASREVTAVAAMVHDGATSISQTEAAAEGLRQYASELQRLTNRFKIPRASDDD